MVTEFGFSKKLGPLRYEENQEEIFLGHSVAQHKNVSDATAKIIDEEIRRIVEEGETKARKVLTEHRDELIKLATGLLEYETLSGDEAQLIIEGKPIERPDPDEADAPPEGPRSSVPSSGATGQKRPSGSLDPEPQPSN